MESIGAFPDGDWDSIKKMFSTEELDLSSQFLTQLLSPSEDGEGLNFEMPSKFCLAPEAYKPSASEASFFTPEIHVTQGSSYNSGCSDYFFLPTSSPESYYLTDSNHALVTNDMYISNYACLMDNHNNGFVVPTLFDMVMEGSFRENEESSDRLEDPEDKKAAAVVGKEMKLKRKCDVPEINKIASQSKKKACVSRDSKKKKKKKKPTPNNNYKEESNGDGHSCSSYSSDGDNATQETNGKTRAIRGSATDPQSLYARKRREKINNRLRILQNLVPNGTKVDISTMLEEAMHYVKFLQLQIKLLSSDDMWMYAPIAYNGMDIDLDHKISALL